MLLKDTHNKRIIKRKVTSAIFTSALVVCCLLYVFYETIYQNAYYFNWRLYLLYFICHLFFLCIHYLKVLIFCLLFLFLIIPFYCPPNQSYFYLLFCCISFLLFIFIFVICNHFILMFTFFVITF